MQQTDWDIIERWLIRERIDLYADALNHRDWSIMEDLWTKDAVWTTSEPREQRIEGRSTMIEFLRTQQQYMMGYVFQMPHAVVIELTSATTAKARQTLHISGTALNVIGIYYDRLHKETDGKWRFAHRDYQITYLDDQPNPGKSFRMMPDPGYRNLPGD